MLASSWKLFKRCVLVIGVLLSFFAILECVRAYQTLYELHPIAGYAFVGILLASFSWLLWYYVRTVSTRPAVLRPVVIKDPDKASHRDLQRYAKYLLRYLSRLSNNNLLSPEDCDRVRQEIDALQSKLQSHRDQEELVAAIQAVEEQAVQPALGKLDDEANRQVRNCTRDGSVSGVSGVERTGSKKHYPQSRSRVLWGRAGYIQEGYFVGDCQAGRRCFQR